ncbi:hypothetical protein EV175_003528 [Coemansia sp. RSA 1933]|nr:hypothetical protein EV175_003528 [Coemansia sp. RSA 1933]
MTVFNLSKMKLRHAIQDAARDVTVCDKVYDLFAKRATSSGPEDAIDTVLKPIEDTWMQRAEKVRRRGTESEIRIEGEYFSAGITDAMPTEIRRLVALLQVFHGIVLSFPHEMALALGDRTNAARLNRCTQATAVPMDLRMVLVALAARWCIVLADASRTCKSLSYIVDAFYRAFGKFPGLNFLPSAPLVVRIQKGWTYPPLSSRATETGFMYMPAEVRSQLQRQRESLYGSVSRDTVGSEQQAAISQISLILPRAQEAVTSDLLERMDARAMELAAISSMLVDNLVALPPDDNPSANHVIRDLMHEVNRLYEVVSNYISVLAFDHADELQRLRAAIEEARRAQWLYRDTVNAFDDPARSDEGEGQRSTLINHLLAVDGSTAAALSPPSNTLSASPVASPRSFPDTSPIATALGSAFREDSVSSEAPEAPAIVDSRHTAESSAASSSLYSMPPAASQQQPAMSYSRAESSKSAAARMAAASTCSARTSGSSPQTVVQGEVSQTFSPVSALQRVSTKVRGKMPDLAPEDNSSSTQPLPGMFLDLN